MRKKVFGRKLSRERSSREAFFVTLAENLVVHKKIITTKAKAKALIPLIDKLVVLSKKGTLVSKRNVLSKLRGNKKVATILWRDIAKEFDDRNSGFTRIVTLPNRLGDMAAMVRMEFVKQIVSEKEKKVVKKNEKDLPANTKTS